MKTYGTVRYLPAGEHVADDTHTKPRVVGARGAWAVDADAWVAEQLKRWFKQLHTTVRGTLLLSATRDASKDLLWMVGDHAIARFPMRLDDRALTRMRELADEYDETIAVVQRILAGERLGGEEWMAPAVKPRDYQLVAADMAAALGRLLIGDDTGLGKSFEAMLTFRDPDRLPALIVCDTHVQLQQQRMLGEYFPLLAEAAIARRHRGRAA